MSKELTVREEEASAVHLHGGRVEAAAAVPEEGADAAAGRGLMLKVCVTALFAIKLCRIKREFHALRPSAHFAETR